MGFVESRICEISRIVAHLIEDFLVLNLTDETLKLVLILRDNTTLRVSERWIHEVMARYSYYWFDHENRLKIGWDNAPHHKKLENFPHHKHVDAQSNRTASYEISLEDVMRVVEESSQSRSGDL